MSKVIKLKSVKETSLYKELLRRDNKDTKAFVANIPEICEELVDRVKILPKFFYEYTLHDEAHFLRVTELMSIILGQSIDRLNDIEVGLLILSAFTHDQGMLITASEMEELDKNDKYVVFKENWFLEHPNYFETKNQAFDNTLSQQEQEHAFKRMSELESAMLTEYLRLDHGQRGYDFIINSYSNEKRMSINGVNLSSYLASICLSHTKPADLINTDNNLNPDESIGADVINLAFIAVLLRLADILDFDADRTPDVLFKSIHFTSPVSINEWKKHKSVHGWTISKDKIRFTMAFEHPVYEKSAKMFMDWIDYELSEAHTILRSFPQRVKGYKLNIPEKTQRDRMQPKGNAYIYNDIEFTLSRDEVVKLLMTKNLYKNTSLFIRELLQNSLDALRLRKANYLVDNLTWNEGRVIFRHYVKDNGEYVIECSDNGCGMDMDVISKFLGKVGRSYYRSPEFERHRLKLKTRGVDFEPCSKFGIGFMSCFMIGDRIEISTRKDYGVGQNIGRPLLIEINGLGGLMIIREGNYDQPIGTTIKVHSRERPIILDKDYDNIHLVLTLNGYALGNEFPIEAYCEIEAIKESVIIPPELDYKYTFLEERNLKSIKTFEIDLTKINKDLHGVLRQSFLINDSGELCLENDEARWDLISDKMWKDREGLVMSLFCKNDNSDHEYKRQIREEHSVCMDGILISGMPGRNTHTRFEMMHLGWSSPALYSEHPFTVDIRGDIKPEITPAREPADDRSLFNKPLGWRRIQSYLNQGSGNLWSDVLEKCNRCFSDELFWKILIIYGGSISNIFSSTLFNNLGIPTKNNQWLKISDIRYVRISEETLVVETYDKIIHQVEFNDEIKKFGHLKLNDGINWFYWVKGIFIGLSSLKVLDGGVFFEIRNNFSSTERPTDSLITSSATSHMCINFVGFDNTYFIVSQYEELVNLSNPIVGLAQKAILYEKKNSLETFAVSLILVICRYIKQLKQQDTPIQLYLKWRPLKALGAEYLRVNWNLYDNKFKPPYKIYVNPELTLEITDEVLKSWAVQILQESNTGDD